MFQIANINFQITLKILDKIKNIPQNIRKNTKEHCKTLERNRKKFCPCVMFSYAQILT